MLMLDMEENEVAQAVIDSESSEFHSTRESACTDPSSKGSQGKLPRAQTRVLCSIC